MKLALIGVGLIGGSFAKALRAAGCVTEIVGFDTSEHALRRAKDERVIDEAAATAAQSVIGADVVVVAALVGASEAIFEQIASSLGRNCVVTDVASSKAAVIRAARSRLGAAFRRFVPGHPIAGSEQYGVEHSRADLFNNALFVSTPTEETEASAVRFVEQLWRGVGCHVQRMSADDHDRIFAAVSHLPHVLAFALMRHVAAQPDAEQTLAAAGSSFWDMTRIASSSSALWADICAANKDVLVSELDRYTDLLRDWRHAIESGDAESLRSDFEAAASVRRTYRRQPTRP